MAGRAAADDLSRPPDLVRCDVERNAPSGALPAQVQFSQVGEMQIKEGRWLRFGAEQEMDVDRVGFAWRARFRIAPFLSLSVVDRYRDGAGGLEGRLWGRVRVLRARQAQVVQGEAMRYRKIRRSRWSRRSIVGEAPGLQAWPRCTSAPNSAGLDLSPGEETPPPGTRARRCRQVIDHPQLPARDVEDQTTHLEARRK